MKRSPRAQKFYPRLSVCGYYKSRDTYGDEVKVSFVGETGIQPGQERAVEGGYRFESELFGERVVCKAVREDERLAHTLKGEESIGGIVMPVCEKDFCGDAGAEESDKVENIALPTSVREGEKPGDGQITMVDIWGGASLGDMTIIS